MTRFAIAIIAVLATAGSVLQAAQPNGNGNGWGPGGNPNNPGHTPTRSVPEPATLLLVAAGAGIAGVLKLRRRKKR